MSEENNSPLAACLSLIIVLILSASIFAGLGWLKARIDWHPEKRLFIEYEFKSIRKIAIVSFYSSANIRYNRVGALPDEISLVRNIQAVEALCNYHFNIIRILANRISPDFIIMDMESALKNKEYQDIQGKVKITRGIFSRYKPEYLSGHQNLWIIPISNAEDYGWLAPALNVDAILFIKNEYAFELEPIAQKPWWKAVVTSSAYLINQQGETIWRATNVLGESYKVRSESGFNIYILESSKIPIEQILPMFREAFYQNWLCLIRYITDDIKNIEKR